jgi:hypothetical protein
LAANGKQRHAGGQSEKRSKSLAIPSLPLERASRIRLGSVGDTRRELSRIYREARVGRLGTEQACKLCYLLTSIGKLIADETFEIRLKNLERIADEELS